MLLLVDMTQSDLEVRKWVGGWLGELAEEEGR